ncbi:MAG: YfcC family protein [Lachnospiraceae bacterium]|nr:YfcC family protein [Lachnospiraceae bacterium]
MSQEKKKFSFPTAYTVLFIVLIFAAILTWVIPAGSYSKLSYDTETKVFTVTAPDGSTQEMEGSQKTLDELHIKSKFEKFEDGSIYKPIAIPGTYEELAPQKQGLKEVIMAPVSGIQDSIDVILFVFIIGGVIGVLNFTGAFNAGIAALSRATKGREYLLIVFITFLIALGGTTFGLAEETIAFYPILIPIFLAAGYDVFVCIAAIYMGSSIGTMFSTVNPFSAVIASNAAGINFTNGMAFRLIGLIIATIITLVYILRYAKKMKADPTKSLVYEEREAIEAKFKNEVEAPALTFRFKLVLLIFFATFVVMIYGVSQLDWWFGEMTALFLVSGLIIGVLAGVKEKEFVTNFVAGAADLMGVALIIGIARSINIILENGLISDSILHGFSGLVEGMNPNVFIIVMLLIYIVLGFFINSSSGLAVLSIPIMAPLADTVGIPRDAVISAYIFGQGLISFITPTGLILASLEMVDVTYDKWLKFIMPLMGIICAFAAIMLLIQVNF